MSKTLTFSYFQTYIPFLEVQNKIQLLRKRFLHTDLGKIYQAIPLDALIKKLDLTHNTKGPKSIFSPKGKIALEFLKCYTGFSDIKLAQYIRSSIDAQIFCDVYFKEETLGFDYKIISKNKSRDI